MCIPSLLYYALGKYAKEEGDARIESKRLFLIVRPNFHTFPIKSIMHRMTFREVTRP